MRVSVRRTPEQLVAARGRRSSPARATEGEPAAASPPADGFMRVESADGRHLLPRAAAGRAAVRRRRATRSRRARRSASSRR